MCKNREGKAFVACRAVQTLFKASYLQESTIKRRIRQRGSGGTQKYENTSQTQPHSSICTIIHGGALHQVNSNPHSHGNFRPVRCKTWFGSTTVAQPCSSFFIRSWSLDQFAHDPPPCWKLKCTPGSVAPVKVIPNGPPRIRNPTKQTKCPCKPCVGIARMRSIRSRWGVAQVLVVQRRQIMEWKHAKNWQRRSMAKQVPLRSFMKKK
jgi:hypothetical protein